MREIKFRGYLKKDNKMYPVCDLNFNGVDQWGVGISSCGRLDCGLCEDHYERADVEVMQYTGLKDKNGQEIYEGDIVQFYDFWDEISGGNMEGKVRIGVVKYSGSGFRVNDSEDEEYEEDLFLLKINDDELEVVGNIHDNPELLGEET